MKKLTLFFSMLLLALTSAWGQTDYATEVSQLELTTDQANPTWYTIQNVRSSRYLNINNAGTLNQATSLETGSYWYIMADGAGYKLYSHQGKGYAGTGFSAADEPGACYLGHADAQVVDGTAVGFYISKNAAADGFNCLDDNQNGGFSDGWHPATNDYTGTSWKFRKVDVAAALQALQTSAEAQLSNAAVGQLQYTQD